MKKLLIGFLVFTLVLFIFPVAVYADVFTGTDYNVDVQNDDNFFYITFNAEGGDYTIPSSMTNIYILAAGKCWAYTVAGWVGDVKLTYSPSPAVQEYPTTAATVSISSNVMTWQIPLSEMSMVPGDEIAFHFMSFSEGSSSWGTAWLYGECYTLSVEEPEPEPTKSDILMNSGVPGKGLEKAPGLQKPFNPNSQADEHAGMK